MDDAGDSAVRISPMAGFAAATYMRGVNWICVPTTLLSMVDASLGGKTGFDLPEGKNLVGPFKQPAVVLIDVGQFELLQHVVSKEDGFTDGFAAQPRKIIELELVGRHHIGGGQRALAHEFGNARPHEHPRPTSPMTGSQQ